MRFLDALAARAAGTAATVEPRLPSRYEREPADAALTETSSETVARETQSAPNTKPQMWRGLQPALPVEPPTQTNHHHTTLTHTLESQHTNHIETIHDQPHEHTHRHETHNHELHKHDHTTLVHNPSPPATIVREQHHTHEREQAPLRTLLQPRVTRIVEQLRGEPAPREAIEARETRDAAPPPSIRVTIGRVDVRAVTDSVPAKPSAPKKSVFTLDDYIRLRRDGQR